MHCKQADSAILKLLLVQGSMGQIYFITKQTYVVITCFCRNMGYVAFTHIYCHESRFVTNMRFFGFVLSRLLLRHLGFDSDFAQISEQKIGG